MKTLLTKRQKSGASIADEYSRRQLNRQGETKYHFTNDEQEERERVLKINQERGLAHLLKP